MNNLILSVIITFLNVGHLFCQKTITFVDSNNEPIPFVYCHSENKEVRFHANQNGEILPEWKKQYAIIVAEKIGYKNVKFSFDTLQSNHIKLIEQPIELDEVKINISSDLQVITLNKFNTTVKGALGFQNTGLKGIHFSQYLAKSNFVDNSKIIGLNIHASSAHSILNIHFLESDKFGKPGKEINSDVIVFAITSEGWNHMDLSKLNLRVPENGVFIEYEFFDKQITQGPKLQGALTGCEITKENIYPLLRMDTLTKAWVPITFLSGAYSPNLAVTLDVLTTKEKSESIKKSELKSELKSKKIAKIFKKNTDFNRGAKNPNLPNNSIENLLTSSIELLNSKNVNYLLYYFYYIDDKKELTILLNMVNSEKWENTDLSYSTSVLKAALDSVKTASSSIRIENGIHLIPVSVNSNGTNIHTLVKVILTSEGWKFDERDILTNDK